jgi:UDP-N-acetylmuramoylalanine-D-glutamate ligase
MEVDDTAAGTVKLLLAKRFCYSSAVTGSSSRATVTQMVRHVNNWKAAQTFATETNNNIGVPP